MTEYAVLPIGQVTPHPRNIRRATVADDELVASVAAAGIHEPLIVGPADESGVRHVLAGNRRYDAAVKAGLEEVPCLLRDDLADDAAQLQLMLTENLMRADLTAVEEADAYHQLELFGLDAATIAAQTGRSKKTVTARLQLAGASEKAKTLVHTGGATLADVEFLAMLEDDHELHAEVEAALGTPDFRWKMQSARARLDRIRANEETAAELVAGGVTHLDDEDGQVLPEGAEWLSQWSHGEAERAPAAHHGCLGFYLRERDTFNIAYACLAPRDHANLPWTLRQQQDTSTDTTAGEAGTLAGRTAEQEARAEQYRAEREAQDAAAVVRRDWIAEHLTFPTGQSKQGKALAAALDALVPFLLRSLNAMELVGDEDWICRAGDSATMLARVVADFTTAEIRDATYYDDTTNAQDLLHVWDWMTATGYELSTPDQAIYDRAVAALEDDDDVEAGDDQ